VADTPNIPALVALADAALAPWPAYAPCPTCGYGSHDYETIARACYPKVEEQRTALARGVRALAERVATLEAALLDTECSGCECPMRRCLEARKAPTRSMGCCPECSHPITALSSPSGRGEEPNTHPQGTDR
jgi:hypothetical protein